MSTELIGIKGNVFQFARENTDCGCFWVRKGFNSLSVSYSIFQQSVQDDTYLRLPLYPASQAPKLPMRLKVDSPRSSRPYFLEAEDPKGYPMKYLYLFSNPDDSWVSCLWDVDTKLRTMLSALAHYPISTIAMNAMNGTLGQGHSKAFDLEIKQQILRTLTSWLTTHEHSLEKIYLVDAGRAWLDTRLVVGAPEVGVGAAG
jgi:hypothetical protein